MAYEIRELRGDELEPAAHFAREQGHEIEATQVRRRLSVVAHDEQDTMAGMACCSGPRKRLTLDVIVSRDVSQDRHVSLTRQLVDKALLKLRSENVRCCVIRTTTDDTDEQLWSAARWNRPTAEHAVSVA